MRKLAPLIGLVVIFALLLIPAQAAEASGESWLTGFGHRQQFNISSSAAPVGNYTINMTIYKGVGVSNQSTCFLHNDADNWTASVPEDLRFASTDGDTLLDYWIEDSDAGYAKVWVEFDAINVANTDFFIYYGDSTAGSLSNAQDTFYFFDDFSDDSYPTHAGWTSQTAGGDVISETGGQLVINSGEASDEWWPTVHYICPVVYKATQYGNFSARVKVVEWVHSNAELGGILATPSVTDGYNSTRWDCQDTYDRVVGAKIYEGSGTGSQAATGVGTPEPLYLKMARYDTLFNWFYSTNTTLWTYAGNITSFANPAYVGLIVTLGDAYTFDDFWCQNYIHPEPVIQGWGAPQTPPAVLPLAPTDFLVTKWTGSSVAVNWTTGVGANTTLIIAQEGRYPTDRSDGWVVYNSTGTGLIDTEGLSFDLEQSRYRAWSWNPTGFSLNYTSGFYAEGGSMLLLTFMAFGGFMLWFSHKRRELLTSLITGLIWFALAMWVFISDATPFNMAEGYVKILAVVFFVIGLLPLLWQMTTEVQHEEGGRKWTEWKPIPKIPTLSGYEKHQKKLHAITDRARKNAGRRR